MNLHLNNSNFLVSLITGLIITLCALPAGAAADSNNAASKHFSKDSNDANGPTVILNYDPSSPKNPSTSFMYFVPLIAPTLVDLEINSDNSQMARMISYTKNATSKSFYVSCEFEMSGDGFFKNIFNAEQIINIIISEGQKPHEPLTNSLDYIEFEGDGFGRVEVRGTISGKKETVTEVDVHFNARGYKSPVTIGLYDVKNKDGKFKYEDKYNEKIARVSTLTFKKTDGEPRMGVKVSSVYSINKSNGLMGKIKAAIANFFLNPPKVSRIGNETMLNFGYSLYKRQPSFTFPKAANIREYRVVPPMGSLNALPEIDKKKN